MAEGTGGIQIATASGGSGPPAALFVHATGFSKESWRPVVAAMATAPFSWLSLDLRGHGDSDLGDSPYEWNLLAGDVLGVLDGLTGTVGVGHSCGGAALVLAEAACPGTFRHLVLIEPIIFPTPARRLYGPMSQIALKRRAVFESRDTARERFATGPFADWTEEALDAYLDGAFAETVDGFELKCSPAVEADYYAEGSNHDTWDLAGSVDIPVTIVAGERSDTHRDPYLLRLVSRFALPELIVMDDVGHLIPMEDPQGLASIVDAVVAP